MIRDNETIPVTTKKPRIASLLSSATEILFGLGLGEQVVATGYECDWPAEAHSRPRVTFSYIDAELDSGQIDEQVRQRMAAGEPLYGIDRDRLEALAPELIVTQAQCDVCAIRYDDVVALVEQSGALRETKIVSLSPQSLSDVLADIEKIGQAAGVETAAEQYVSDLVSRINQVEQATADVAEDQRHRVAIVEWLDPVMVAANWTPGLVTRAGGQYALAVDGQHSVSTTWDEVIAYDPEVVIVSPCGFDLPRTLQEWAQMPKPVGWDSLSAVEQGRVFAIDGNAYLNRSGPRLVDSLEILANIIHPERFALPNSIQKKNDAWQRLNS